MRGRQFRLKKPTACMYYADGDRIIGAIPERDVVLVTTDISHDGLVGVTWKGKSVAVFAQDIRAHGAEVLESRRPAMHR